MEQKECKVFLSSSNNLLSHRKIVQNVVDELNDNMGKYMSGIIRLYRWESETTPQMGRPQAVIFDQSSFDDIDVFIGLIGSYLGNGTKEEFDEAYASYQAVGKPEIMIFHDVSPLPGDKIDLEQIGKAHAFIDNFNEGGTHPGLVTTYKTPRELEKKIRKALTEYILSKQIRKQNMSAYGQLSFLNRIAESGISNFYIGREEWQTYRRPPRLSDYLLTAKCSVRIATYWLAQGSIEGIVPFYRELILQGIPVQIVTIAPTDYIVESLSPDMNETPDTIKTYVTLTLQRLIAVKKQLPLEKQPLMSICTSNAIPQAAVIAIDTDTSEGRLQLEFRPYGTPRSDSFSIELTYEKNARLYQILSKSWNRFFSDAVEYLQD